MGACCTTDQTQSAHHHRSQKGKVSRGSETITVRDAGKLVATTGSSDVLAELDYSVFVANAEADEDFRAARAAKESMLWAPIDTQAIAIAELPMMSLFVNLLLEEELRREQYRELLLRHSTIGDLEKELRHRRKCELLLTKYVAAAVVAQKSNSGKEDHSAPAVSQCDSCGGYKCSGEPFLYNSADIIEHAAATYLRPSLLSDTDSVILYRTLRSVDRLWAYRPPSKLAPSERAQRKSSVHWADNSSFMPRGANASNTNNPFSISINDDPQRSSNNGPYYAAAATAYLPEPASSWRTPSTAMLAAKDDREPSWASVAGNTKFDSENCSPGAKFLIDTAAAAYFEAYASGEPKRRAVKAVLRALRVVLPTLGIKLVPIDEDEEDVALGGIAMVTSSGAQPPILAMRGQAGIELGSGVLAVSTGNFKDDTSSERKLVANSLTNAPATTAAMAIATPPFQTNLISVDGSAQHYTSSPVNHLTPQAQAISIPTTSAQSLKIVAKERATWMASALSVGIAKPSISFTVPQPPLHPASLPSKSNHLTSPSTATTIGRSRAATASPSSHPTHGPRSRSNSGKYAGKGTNAAALASLLSLTASAKGGKTTIATPVAGSSPRQPQFGAPNGVQSMPYPLMTNTVEAIAMLPARRLCDRIPNTTPSHHSSSLLLPARGFAIASFRHPLAPAAALLLAQSTPIPPPVPLLLGVGGGLQIPANNEEAFQSGAGWSHSSANDSLIARMLKGIAIVGRYGSGGRGIPPTTSPPAQVIPVIAIVSNGLSSPNEQQRQQLSGADGGNFTQQLTSDGLGVLSPISLLPPSFPSPLASASAASVKPPSVARGAFSKKQRTTKGKKVQWRDLNGLGLRALSIVTTAAPLSNGKASVASNNKSLVASIGSLGRKVSASTLLPPNPPRRSSPVYLHGEANSIPAAADTSFPGLPTTIIDEWEEDIADDEAIKASLERRIRESREEKDKKKRKKSKKGSAASGIPPNLDGALRASELPFILADGLLGLPRKQRLLLLRHTVNGSRPATLSPSTSDSSLISQTQFHGPEANWATKNQQKLSKFADKSNSAPSTISQSPVDELPSWLPPLDEEDLYGVGGFDTLWMTLQAIEM